MLLRIRKTWAALRGRDQWESNLDAELRTHIALRAADLERSGLSTKAAERQARIELGSRERYRDEARAAFGLRWFDDLRHDVHYAVRTLRRSPGFTITAILSMALGVGANTAVFGVLNAALFRPVPGEHPERLLFVERASPSVSFPSYRDLRDRATTIDGAIAYRVARMGVDEGQGAKSYWGYLATGNYFDLLGLKPAVGRFFRAEDEKGVNASPYAVLSYDLWQRQFQGDPNVNGRTVRLNARPYTVLGVAPKGFRGTEAFISADLWVPMMMAPQIERADWLEARGAHNVWMMVRVKEGVNEQRVREDLNRIAADLATQYPATDRGPGIRLAKPGMLGSQVRGPIEQFVAGVMIVAGLVLLAACVNLAALMGARGADRNPEIALRLSIGAGRGRLLRQLLTESVALTGTAGVLGCAAAWVILRALSQWQPPVGAPIQVDVLPDARVFLFALALSVLTGVLSGIAPVRQAWRMNTNDAMKGVTTRAQRRWPVRDALLVVQTALCCVLVVCSVVAVRGLLRTFDTRPGFDAEGVSVVAFDPLATGRTPEESAQFRQRALEAVLQLPGVISAAYSKSVPLTTDESRVSVFPESAVEYRLDQGHETRYFDVSPGFFKTIGTRLLAGREFELTEAGLTPPVAIVNDEFARQIVGTADAVGRRFRSYRGTLVTIVGVVETGKYSTYAEAPKPVVFWPILQRQDTETLLLARSSRPEAVVAAEMARVVKALDPALPIYGSGSLISLTQLAFLPGWIASIAMGAFGMLAVMLAVTGIYGLASYSVSRRVREIGIRLAVGARPAQVLRAVMGRLALLVAGGSIAGISLGIASSQLLSVMVYQASPRDPVTLAAVGAIMSAIAVLSALGPIRRAISIEPLRALREG